MEITIEEVMQIIECLHEMGMTGKEIAYILNSTIWEIKS